jgi:hypothetical protein
LACNISGLYILIPNGDRRNWFLERVLKLGLTPLAKEYQCVSLTSPSMLYSYWTLDVDPQCSTCPDSAICARLLEEKWRQAYNAVFRFGQYIFHAPLTLTHRSVWTGPCQPSIVYRFLRTLEGVSPPLSLTHLACQTTAKAFTATRKSDLLRYVGYSHPP